MDSSDRGVVAASVAGDGTDEGGYVPARGDEYKVFRPEGFKGFDFLINDLDR